MGVPQQPCPEVQAPAVSVTIELPGGLTLMSAPPATEGIVTELQQVSSLMAALQPALAGLSPMLKTLDAMMAIFDALTAVPEVPTDPAGFFEAMVAVTEKMGALAPLIPQVSVPATVISSVKAIRAFLVAIRDSVAKVAAMATEAQALLDQAASTGDTALATEAQCQLDFAEALAEHANASMGPLGSIMTVVSSFMEMVPVGFVLPAVGDMAGLGPAELLEALDAVIAAFDALPLPA